MKIVRIPHPVLQAKVRPIQKIDRKIQTIVHNMIVMLERETDPEGVGLAANQVGLPLALFIMKPSKKAPVMICINPKIISLEPVSPPRVQTQEPKKPRTKARLEGCLSIPRLWGYVERSPRVHLAYSDLEGKIHQRAFAGFDAVIVQHEMDHLQGVVFTQRVLEQQRKLYQEVDGELEPLKI